MVRGRYITHRVNKNNNTAVRAAYDRKRKLKKKIEDNIAVLKKQQAIEEKTLAALVERKKLIDSAPTVKEQRALLQALFKKNDFEPIEEMIAMLKKKGKGAPSTSERISLLKELGQYQVAKPKSVDIQADMKMNVTVQAVDFSATNQALLKLAAEEVIELEDEEYDEFSAQEES